MILSYAKPFNEEMREQLVKIIREKGKNVGNFSTISTDDIKNKEKNANPLCWYKNTQQ